MKGGVVALATVALTAVAVTAADASNPWTRLHRALHLPRLAAGGSCPVSGVGTFDFRRYGVARGIGPGPAYPVGFEQPGSVLRIQPAAATSVFSGSEWGGQKVLWFVAPSYRGPLLIRGGRIDAGGLVRFDRGAVPPAELRIPRALRGGNPPDATPVGQRYRPSYTRLLGPGCYAYQIDGTTFSRTIVFSAVAAG